MDDDGECVSEVKIRELNLILGQRFIYLFDYGAEWIFNITLESINEKYKSKNLCF